MKPVIWQRNTFVRHLATATLGSAGMLLAYTSTEAEAVEICMEARALEAALIDWYDERPARAVSDNIIFWESASSGTWTVVRYMQDGAACTIDQGTNLSNPNKYL